MPKTNGDPPVSAAGRAFIKVDTLVGLKTHVEIRAVGAEAVADRACIGGFFTAGTGRAVF